MRPTLRQVVARGATVTVANALAFVILAAMFPGFDVDGVGALVEIAVRLGRSRREGIELGVCGEHGGDPDSIAFFHRAGLDYVSCSPYRLPIARVAAAQAALS